MAIEDLAERLYRAWWPPEEKIPIPWSELEEEDRAPFVRAAGELERKMGMRGGQE